MAVGFTINHIAAVFLPAIGGFLWVVDSRHHLDSSKTMPYGEPWTQ
ncbi:MAG: hypothetical protein PVG06_16025 [Desulfobacterales bacterium]|jgi:hypothetical protein